MNQFKENEPGKQTVLAGECGSIRILVADDHAPMRQVLVDFLQSQEDFDVVDQADTGRDAVQKVTALKPHVVLIDVSMPEV